MISLQDLRDDVAAIADDPGARFDDLRIYYAALYGVARRVLALFDDCPDCIEMDEVAMRPEGGWEIVPCSRCGGTGVVASEEAYGLAGVRTSDFISLARYLFADSGPEGGER
jgi:Zn ribbon nucleic-acid-binding protein